MIRQCEPERPRGFPDAKTRVKNLKVIIKADPEWGANRITILTDQVNLMRRDLQMANDSLARQNERVQILECRADAARQTADLLQDEVIPAGPYKIAGPAVIERLDLPHPIQIREGEFFTWGGAIRDSSED